MSDKEDRQKQQCAHVVVPPASRRQQDDDEHKVSEPAVATADYDTKARHYCSNIPSLVAAFLASLTTGGTTYAFGLYGDALKKTLHLTQSQLDTISTAFFFAGLLSWLPGMCADRFGTRTSLSCGGLLGALTTCLYWTVATQRIILPRSCLVPVLSILGVSIFLSCATVTGSVFKIIVASCGAGTKGQAVGVAKGFVGLGAGAYAILFESLKHVFQLQSNLDFLPMAAFFFCACATLPAWILLPNDVAKDIHVELQDEATPLHFRTLFGSLLVLGALVVTDSLSELSETHAANYRGPSYGTTFLIVFIWIVPILSLLILPRRPPPLRPTTVLLAVMDDDDEVVREAELEDKNQAMPRSHDPLASRADDDKDDHTAPLTDNEEHNNLLGHGKGRRRNASRDATDIAQAAAAAADDDDDEQLNDYVDDENFNLMQMLQSPSAWLMLWSTMGLVGAGTVITNNMAQMVESLHLSDVVTPASLALFSVAQAAARVLTGAVSELALNWNTRSCGIDNGVPRPFFLVVAALLSCVAHFILAVATEEFGFVTGVALAGAAFGMVWPLMVLIVGEVFGSAHVGANYMFFDGFTSAAGTLLLSKWVAGDVYEHHIDANSDDPLTCFGVGCFAATHLVIAALSLSCVGTSVAMMITSRHVYNKCSLHAA